MIIAFNNPYLQKIYEGKQPGGKSKFSTDVITKFKKTVLMLQNTESNKNSASYPQCLLAVVLSQIKNAFVFFIIDRRIDIKPSHNH